MAESEEIDDFEAQLEALETSLGAVTGMAAAFDGEMRRVHWDEFCRAPALGALGTLPLLKPNSSTSRRTGTG